MKHVLLIDNYDSFTYNLYQYVGEIADKVTVVRNDQVPFERVHKGDFTHLILSPGPGDPTDRAYFKDCQRVIEEFHGTYPLLGICLGHQGIGAAFGSKIVRAPVIMHGKTSRFNHSGEGLLRGLPSQITVMRYHSLAIEPKTLPGEFLVDAIAGDGSIMAMHHTTAPTYGLQFHPESFATPEGKQMLRSFLDS
jgi:anthranilate synthase component 2